MVNAIEITNLSKTYPRRKDKPVQAVASLDLAVPTGQVLGFLGANGAGKTTTIKMMCGLVLPSTGQVCLNRFDVTRQRRMAMQQVGAVLEGTRNVYWRLSAMQNLIYFGRLKGVSGKALYKRAEQLLTELDLWARRDDPVNDFSRGMQQKVALACALVADPPIVLLDEPTLGLDVHAARTVKAWVQELASKRGKTVILTTHQLDMAEEVCDRVVIVQQGKVVADKPTTDLLDLFRQEFYEFHIEGHFEEDFWQPLRATFSDLSVVRENGHSVLTSTISNQEMLHTLLSAIKHMQLTLVSVQQAEPNLEDVFVQLTKEKVQ